MMKLQLGIVLSGMLTTPALADVTVTDPWARATILASRPGAAYLTIESSADDRLLDLSSPVASDVMIHATETDAEGVNRMAHVEALDLPAGKPVTMAPGGMHLMLMGLNTRLEEGMSFPLTLTFEKVGEITVEVPVLGVAAAGPGDG